MSRYGENADCSERMTSILRTALWINQSFQSSPDFTTHICPKGISWSIGHRLLQTSPIYMRTRHKLVTKVQTRPSSRDSTKHVHPNSLPRHVWCGRYPFILFHLALHLLRFFSRGTRSVEMATLMSLGKVWHLPGVVIIFNHFCSYLWQQNLRAF